jgi:mannose-6-phosphate isomerase-like protein (cupin superfamily)
MHQYIFDESEWKNFKEEKYGHTLVAVDGSHYQSIDMGAMEARLPGSETYDRLLGVNSFHPGGVYEAHEHQTPMFYYVLQGTGQMRVGDEERVITKGSWVYTPPGLKHYTKNIGEDLLAYLFFGGNPHDPNAGIHEPPRE